MIIARRVYLYVVSFVALWMFVVGTANLMGLPLQQRTSVGRLDLADALTYNGAVAFVGLVGWLVHWAVAQHVAARDVAERQARIRQLFFGLASLSLLSAVAVMLVGVVQVVLVAALRGRPAEIGLGLAENATSLGFALVGGAAWAYLWHAFRRDAERGESVAGRHVRRADVYLVGTAGLALATFGLAMAVAATWEHLVQPSLDRPVDAISSVERATDDIAGGLAMLLVFGAIGALHQRWADRQAGTTNPAAMDERGSAPRLAGAVALLTVAAGGTLIGVWLATASVAQVALASLAPPERVPDTLRRLDLDWAVGLAVVFGCLWLLAARRLGGVARERIAARRTATTAVAWLRDPVAEVIAALAVAGTGLLALTIGAGNALRLAVQWLGPSAHDHSQFGYWFEQGANAGALTVVGSLIVVTYWRRVRRDSQRTVGTAFLADVVAARRVSAYLVFLSGTLALLGFGTLVVYRLLGWAFGVETREPFVDLVAGPFAAVVVVALTWWQQRWVLTADASLVTTSAPAAVEAMPETTVVLLRGLTVTEADAAVASLRASVPATGRVVSGRLSPDDVATLVERIVLTGNGAGQSEPEG